MGNDCGCKDCGGSRKHGPGQRQPHCEAVQRLGPLPKVQVRSRNILRLLQSDKKTRDGVVHFILPREIGKVEVVNNVPEQVVIEAVDELRRLSK